VWLSVERVWRKSIHQCKFALLSRGLPKWHLDADYLWPSIPLMLVTLSFKTHTVRSKGLRIAGGAWLWMAPHMVMLCPGRKTAKVWRRALWQYEALLQLAQRETNWPELGLF